MLDHAVQLAQLPSIERERIELGQPPISAIRQLGQSAARRSFRHTESGTQATKSSAPKSDPDRPPRDIAMVESPYT